MYNYRFAGCDHAVLGLIESTVYVIYNMHTKGCTLLKLSGTIGKHVWSGHLDMREIPMCARGRKPCTGGRKR